VDRDVPIAMRLVCACAHLCLGQPPVGGIGTHRDGDIAIHLFVPSANHQITRRPPFFSLP